MRRSQFFQRFGLIARGGAVVGLMAGLLAIGCKGRPTVRVGEVADTACVVDTAACAADTPTEARLRKMGLVDVREVDSSIQVRLVYATADNFAGQVLYADLHKAFLLPEMAEKVAAAQQTLHEVRPDLDLLVLDAARPMEVQREMFSLVAGTPQNIYVSNPNRGGGLHNYGAAVDVTLVDATGRCLPMGTEFDHFGFESHIDNESALLATGHITQEELDNRRLLRRVMKDQGLLTIRTEWWHFNLMSRNEARRTLPLITAD